MDFEETHLALSMILVWWCQIDQWPNSAIQIQTKNFPQFNILYNTCHHVYRGLYKGRWGMFVLWSDFWYQYQYSINVKQLTGQYLLTWKCITVICDFWDLPSATVCQWFQLGLIRMVTSQHPGKKISHVAGKTISYRVTISCRCLCPLCPCLTWVKKYADHCRIHHPTSSYLGGVHPSTSSARRLPHQPRNSSQMGFKAQK